MAQYTLIPGKSQGGGAAVKAGAAGA